MILFCIILCALAACSVMYRRAHKSEFISTVFWGLSCTAIGSLFYYLSILLIGKPEIDITISDFSKSGYFWYLTAVLRGPLTSLCDDGSKELRKYRMISLCVSILIILLFIFWCDESFLSFLLYLPPCAVLSYYLTKLLIIKDVKDGIIRPLYPFLCSAFLNILIVFISLSVNDGSAPIVSAISLIAMDFCPFISFILAWYGVKKW